jgi:hypothetical protein
MSILLVEGRQSQRKGRQSCMFALVVNDRTIKLEFENSKKISVLKLKTVDDKSLSPNKCFAYNGSTYTSCNNNRNEEYELELGILDATYKRISSEGFKPVKLRRYECRHYETQVYERPCNGQMSKLYQIHYNREDHIPGWTIS